MEETAVAVEALLAGRTERWNHKRLRTKDLHWLVAAVESGRHREPSPDRFILRPAVVL